MWKVGRDRTAWAAPATLACVMALALTLIGCASDPDSGKADEPSAQTRAFIEACLKLHGFDRAVCECTAERSEAELSEDARAFVIASLMGDRPEIKRLQRDLTMEDALAAGKFMADAPNVCAEGVE